MGQKSSAGILVFLSSVGDLVKSDKLDTIKFAEVMDNTDAARMGRLRVFIHGTQGNKLEKNNWRTVLWSSPFAGSTNLNNVIKGGDTEEAYSGTQRSYGMWMTPPDVGNLIVVAFVDGNDNMGVCLGCLFQPGMNHMVPGIAKGQTFSEKDPKPVVPLAEHNRKGKEAEKLNLYEKVDGTKPIDNVLRSKHEPMFASLTTQGLENDNIRGLTDSSARRESPSGVFGFLTPGGHHLVMDDLSQKHIRLRTVGGAQILLDDSNSTVYVINSKGTGWVEISENGKIELWGADSISMRSEKDVNIRADRDLNLESGRHTNIRAHKTDANGQPKTTTDLGSVKGNVHIQSAGSFKVSTGTDAADNIDMSTTGTTNIYSGVNHNFTALGVSNINAAGGHFETASVIHMNGPVAGTATPVSGIDLQVDADGNLLYTNVLQTRTGPALNDPRQTEANRGSINTRFPTREPYPFHESQSTENSGESS